MMTSAELDVIIIGAGTAGLSARREVSKISDRYLVIDDGPLGTTCARVGCMPSKVLIEAANLFASRSKFDSVGISGADQLRIDSRSTMQHVRKLRDRFVRGVIRDMESWTEKHLIRGRASFVDQHSIRVNDQIYKAQSIIIATGSRPIVPRAWAQKTKRLLTSDEIFEIESLPKSMAVIGLGVIGMELGQALSRLGVHVVGFNRGEDLAGVSDPEISSYLIKTMRREFSIHIGDIEDVSEQDHQVVVDLGGNKERFDYALIAMGRQPNIDGMGLEEIGIPLDQKCMPTFDRKTFRIGETPIFFAGDVNGERPILHEAADEGRIAGYNAVRDSNECFKRRTPMGICFNDPNFCYVGQKYRQLSTSQQNFVTGKVSFEGQGRAIVKLKECGMLHVYADAATGKVLGAEILAPEGEHLAHLLAWSIESKLSVFDLLAMPFYHPVLEEGLRTALRDAASKVKQEQRPLEVLRCQDALVGT